MTLTPEKLDELERLAELAHGGPRAVTYDRDGNAYEVVFAKAQHRRLFLMPSDGGTKTEADAELCAALDPATVRELVRLARKGAGFMEIMNFKDKGDNSATVQLLRNLAWEDLPEIQPYKEPPK